jgi:hypothetical protein
MLYYIKEAFLKALLVSLLTLFVYQLFYIEFIRASVEDAAFDTTSWYRLSKTATDMNVSNTFILLVDDKYLKSENLLDENNETNYGYIMPREYLAKIITSVDTLVSDIDEENYPKALFLDYDLSYLSDPNNKIASQGDLQLLEVLKKRRPYTIYLPMTSNYNFIYHSKKTDAKFVSVGLTTASDNVSRRYYAYETYLDLNKTDKKFMNVAIELWRLQNDLNKSVLDDFSQTGLALVENRIIFKDKHITQNDEYTTWQSNWKQLSAMSANYPLDMIYEDDLKGSIIMVGAAHNASLDTFEIDAYSRVISGIEMHANALMSLNYLGGKLKRLPLIWNLLIVFSVVFVLDVLLSILYKSDVYQKSLLYKERFHQQWKKSIISFLLISNEEDFHNRWLILSSLIVMFLISDRLLISDGHYWFNWLIPVMLSFPYAIFMSIRKMIKN